MKKICNCCEKEVLVELFGKQSSTWDGIRAVCKQCAKEKSKLHNVDMANRKESCKQWREKNRQYHRDYDKWKRGKLPDFKPRGRTPGRSYDESQAANKAYAKNNSEKTQAYQLAYRTDPENRLELNKKAKQRRDSNIQTKMTSMLRSRLRYELNRRHLHKSHKAKALLDCDLKFFIKWLEMHFQKNMTWDNYGLGKGKWHVDHHRPCSSFDLSDPQQQKECFRWTNMFPLWAHDNNVKYCSVPEPKDWQI